MQKEEKILIIFLIVCICIVNILIFLIFKFNNYIENNLSFSHNNYYVYQNDNLISSFEKYEEALEYAKKYENSSIKEKGKKDLIWDSTPVFEVYQEYNILNRYDTFKEALEHAKKYENSSVFNRKTSKFIWNNKHKNNFKKSHFIQNVPFVGQYPELLRGCEVTSLTMLLKYRGIEVNKMELASKITKEPFIFNLSDGKSYNGNPNLGFVGDMYSFKNPGYGVYNEPIYNLLYSYVGEEALNLTGLKFEDLYYYIDKNLPIWVITNTRFKKLPENEFEYLKTTRGNVKITYREHSVLITGYDENYIYFNDPLYPDTTQKKDKKEFIKAWEQMGSQALTYYI